MKSYKWKMEEKSRGNKFLPGSESNLGPPSVLTTILLHGTCLRQVTIIAAVIWQKFECVYVSNREFCNGHTHASVHRDDLHMKRRNDNRALCNTNV